ncbi:NACHT domain-containing protein [Actinoplanes subglobosus]|uniref:NACHT domain-containing protein n=1 Tax=Actinoplanes subglobosus TaxID=1547892 RepID=A0ABV8IWR4_9ACTN
MRLRPGPLLALAVASAFALVGNLATNTVEIEATWIKWSVWAAALVLLGAALLVEQLKARADRATPPDDDTVARTVDELALFLRAQWKDEETRRKVRAPVTLPVTWHTVTDDQLVDHWENIRLQPLGSSAAALHLDGGIDTVLDVYRRIPSARLVILGRAGAGKTVLSGQLLLSILEARQPGEAVPVAFNLRTWDPSTPLRTWLAERLAAGYPQLTHPGLLLDRDLILPILDGFDEINPGLHTAAMQTLDLMPGPMVLTSRPVQFTDAITSAQPLGSAAVVHLDDLPLAAIAQYLPRTMRHTTSAWTSVFDRITADPGGAGEGNVTKALTTPLMVYLARTIYSGSRSPAELLDVARYPTAKAIEQHLLSAFIPAVYGEGCPEQRWLTTLASILERSRTQNLAWWRLRDSVPAPIRVGAFALAFSVGFGSVLLIVTDVESAILISVVGSAFLGPAFGLPRKGPTPVRGRLRYSDKLRGTVENIVAGIIIWSLWAGLFTGNGVWALGGALFGMAMSARRAALIGATFAALGGAALSIMIGPSAFHATLGMIMVGAFAGGWAGFAGDLGEAIETAVDMDSVAYPLESLKTDRINTLRRSLAVAATFGLLIVGLSGGSDWLGALGIGAGTGLVAALGTAWVQWLILARVWLPLRGRLPWRLPAFLDDAHDRGVLRQSGGFFQLRHELLQRHLALSAASSGPGPRRRW